MASSAALIHLLPVRQGHIKTSTAASILMPRIGPPTSRTQLHSHTIYTAVITLGKAVPASAAASAAASPQHLSECYSRPTAAQSACKGHYDSSMNVPPALSSPELLQAASSLKAFLGTPGQKFQTTNAPPPHIQPRTAPASHDTACSTSAAATSMSTSSSSFLSSSSPLRL